MSSTSQWPTFIIAGAGRSGKIALCHHLCQHPEIFITQPPEPNFFCFVNEKIDFKSPDKLFYQRIITNVDEYNKLFTNGEGLTEKGEASGSYLKYADKSISTISDIVPDYKKVKILITLRNPVDRAFSSYSQYVMHGFEQLSFLDAISEKTIQQRLSCGWSPNYDYLGGGLYSESVKKYLDSFPNTKIIISEEMKAETYSTLKDCFCFLGVNENFKPTIRTKINVSGGRKNFYLHQMLYNENNFLRKIARSSLKYILPENKRMKLKDGLRKFNLARVDVNPEIRNRLIDFYSKDILKLEKIINHDLSSWLSS